MLAQTSDGAARPDPPADDQSFCLPSEEPMDLEPEESTQEPLEVESAYPSATSDAMATYVNIDANLHLTGTSSSKISVESMPCECKYDPDDDDPDAACGDDNTCINRMMYMECMLEDCPSDRYCRNRRFQLRQFARVDVIRTEKKGFGLRALTDLPRNAFVMEYLGEIIPNREFVRRTRVYEKEGLKHYYFMTLKTDEIIDATRKGCLARFINHSCNPNCETQKWVVGKTMRIGIFTKQAVKAGTELTFDYKFERYGARPQECFCGESNCKGFIGGASKALDDVDVDLPEPDELDSVADDLGGITLAQRMMHQKKKPIPLHISDVRDFGFEILESKGDKEAVLRLLHRLELTTDPDYDGRDALKYFIKLHGLYLLKFWILEWNDDNDIIIRVLTVLLALPLSNRNSLEDSKLDTYVENLQEHSDSDIRDLALQNLEQWKDLKRVYRIPKRAATESSTKSRSGSNKKRKASLDDTSEQPLSKQPHYASTRAFMDRDDDYYEYLGCEASAEDIYASLCILPAAQVPTAPRAMLSFPTPDNMMDWEAHALTPPIPTGPSQMTAANGHLDSHSPAAPAPIATVDDLPRALPPNWSAEMDDEGRIYYANSVTLESQWELPTATDAAADTTIQTAPVTNIETENQHQQPQEPLIPTSPSIATATDDMNRGLPINWTSAVNEEGRTYYYHLRTRKTQWEFPDPDPTLVAKDEIRAGTPSSASSIATAPPLPPNWVAAIDAEGATYYYHAITLKTQWFFPEAGDEKVAANDNETPIHSKQQQQLQQQQQQQHPLPSPHNDDSPASLSRTPHAALSVPSIPATTTPRSSSPPTRPSSQQTPGDASDAPAAWTPVEFKKQTGAIITKYLSSTKMKPLWAGDKQLFKDLARIITHHVCDKEAEASRKHNAMTPQLRKKIERLIDDHGSTFAKKARKGKTRAAS
ncbi:hypothetical protein BC940DRAFT_293312 [Gongronella butleri]|nr:hypothetical protein BC940DRAFT_293312 [Gongronella butleri]